MAQPSTNVATPATSAATSASDLYRLLLGGRLAQAISVTASLGIPDLLAAGPRTSDDLAARTESDPDALYRLLRTVAAAGVLREEPDRHFALTELGDVLRTDNEASLHGTAINAFRPVYLEVWATLEHSIRTGENGFRALHGEDVWSWRSRDPEESAIFNRGMVSQTAALAPVVAEAYDFSGLGTLVDVGGGSGTILAAILARYPSLRGILFDQPHVVEEAATRALLERAGVLDRVEIVGGSFFERAPAGADAYLLKAILHDWEDPEAIAILRTVREAAPPTSRLLVVEGLVGPPNTDLVTKLSDLNMLVMPGGRERTEAEWRGLFERGGFELAEIRPLTPRWSLLVGRPRPADPR